MSAKHLVIIMSDEHDPRFLGCAGHPRVQTPHLDALAARGTRFTQAITPSPICVPARAAFATGRRVHDIRYWDNAMPYHGVERGWGHALQDQGIRVESVGKLHYRAAEDPAGFDREIIPMHVVGGYGMVWASIRDPYLMRDSKGRMLGKVIGPGESDYTAYDRSVTAESLKWLAQARADEPFVLYIGLVAPHFPLTVPQQFFDLYPPEQMPEPKYGINTDYVRHPWVQEYYDFSRNEEKFTSPRERLMAIAAYHGLCSWLDHNIGQILGAIESAGLADDTHVIYTSDHGDNVGARGVWGKSNLYQESVAVPMILAGPGVPVGTCDTPVDLLDLYPTILQAMGLVPDADDDRPGRSLFDMALGEPDPDRIMFSEYHAAGSNTAAFMLRKGRWKYIHYVRHRPELFDLQDDPEELHDRAADPACATVLAQMRAELLAICDPEAIDQLAKQDQAAMIERFGGPEAASLLGAGGATPPPAT